MWSARSAYERQLRSLSLAKKKSVHNALRRHRQSMLAPRVGNNVPPSVAEQETSEIVEGSNNSEIDGAAKRTNVESSAAIVDKAGRPCGAGATQGRKVTIFFVKQ